MKRLSILLALLGLILGFRHLSWLRGREEPLPAVKPALVSTLFGPVALAVLLAMPNLSRLNSRRVFEFHPLLTNTIAFVVIFLLGLWGLRRTLAWTRNLRQAPRFRIAHVAATALVALAVAIPFTYAQEARYVRSSELASTPVWDYNSSFEDHQLAISAIQVDFDKEGPGRFFPKEKVREARSAIEAYSDAYQRLKLSNARPFGLEFPKGSDRIVMLTVPPVAFLLAFFIVWKCRPRRRRA